MLFGYVGADAKPAPVTQHDLSEYMVVMKLKPEFETALPRGTALSCGIPSLDGALAGVGVTGVRRLHPNAKTRIDLPRLDLWIELRLSGSIDPHTVVSALRDRPEIQAVETFLLPIPAEIPDDPGYGNQYYLPQIMAPEAWDLQKGDSTVVIAIVDDAVDYTHPDLWNNVFTNELEFSGLPGVDDDGNGYVDDIHGYDVADDDPEASSGVPGHTHGTQVTGNAAAVTDNGIGVASPSWNCEYLPVKASLDSDPDVIGAAYEGIEYAALMGADVINCSWGRGGTASEYQQEVIDYATGLGSLVVAAAGNDGTSEFHWPSAYLNVVSVAAVNANDVRAGFTNFGRTVDITAAGVNTYSTQRGGGYGYWGGTSASSPIASGLAALIKSGQPGMNPDQLARQLVLTADNIDDSNPGYEGLLGIGRINAYRAVTETELEEYPYVEMVGWTVEDPPPGGDGDSWILQGEEAGLWIIYWSYTVSPAENAMITLTTEAEGVEILNGVSDEGTIAADTIATSVEALTFRVAQDAPSQRADMYITFEAADGYWQQDTLSISIGLSPVLVIDDDDGDNNVETYYTTVLDTLGAAYLVWDHIVQGVPDSLTLLNFPIVIWSCEWTFPSLEPDDRASLGAYLDGGGTLYMSGQDIGWDLCDPGSDNTSPEAVAWYNGYLHALYVADDSNIQSVVGVEADPIGDDLSFNLFQPGRNSENQYPSVVDPYGGETYPVFRYNQSMDAAVRYRQDYGVVYTAFGFEAVSGTATINPVDDTGNRTELMRRILNYLNPIVHTPLRDTEDVTAPIAITANMTAPGVPESLWVIYSTNLGSSWTEALMVPQGGGTFEVVLPGPNEETDFFYYFETRNISYTWRYPVRDPIMFHIGPDTVLPEMTQLSQLPAALLLDGPRSIQVRATDNLGIDLESGLVHFMTEDVYSESSLTFLSWIGEEAVFEGFVDPIGSYGDTVYYYASVADVATTPNRGYSDTLSYVYGLEDFETDLASWDSDTDWVRQTGGTPHSGDWIARDSEGTGYPPNANNALTLAHGLDLSDASSARVTFWIMFGLEENHDFCYLEASGDGQNWSQLLALTGRQLLWTQYDVSLGDFVGQGGDNVLIRFRLVSDEETAQQGVYLDDVFVETDVLGSPDDHDPLPTAPKLSLQPNPSSGEVLFHVSGVTGKSTVKIYDVSGHLVKTLTAPAENAVIRWDGRNDQGQNLASGLYFVRVPVSNLNGKVVLIR